MAPKVIQNALFPLGEVVGTPAAIDLLAQQKTSLFDLLLRHVRLDSDVEGEDAELNQQALQNGGRILSVFKLGTGDAQKLWLITESDRSVTTALLPSEY